MLHRCAPQDLNSLPANENMKVYPENLDRMLSVFKKKYNCIAADDIASYIKHFHFKKFVAFTFDDGYKDNLTYALPIFKKHNIPFTIFVAASFPQGDAIMWWYALEELILENSQIVLGNGKKYDCTTKKEKQKVFLAIRLEILKLNQLDLLNELNKMFCNYKIDWQKYPKELALSWGDIETLNKEPLVTIGGHTYNHYNLKALPSESDVEKEIKAGIDCFTKHGINTRILAYPFGTKNEVSKREINFMKKNKLGITSAFLASGGWFLKTPNANNFSIPRLFLANNFLKNKTPYKNTPLKNKLRILHINTSDSSGGAAIAANRLNNAMLKFGIDSKLLVQEKKIIDDENVLTKSIWDFYVFSKIRSYLEIWRSKRVPESLGMFSYFKSGTDFTKLPAVKDADIIYLHWVNSGFLNFRNIEKILKLGKPVYWFMHDMFPITGGCHYSFECSEYEKKCRKCPFFKGKNISYASKEFSKKSKVFKKYKNLSFVAPSSWLYECAKKSVLTNGHKVFHVPNLIDLNQFRPIDKNFARNIFGIDTEKKVIAFGADGALTNPYKGFEYFKTALKILHEKHTEKNIVVLIFGSSFNKKIKDEIPFECVFAGRLYDRYSLLAVYNAADIFVTPSLAENFPNTIVESFSCGTPVVGFDVGGIPDLVSGKTGYLATYRDSEDLANGIAKVLGNHNAYSENCFEFVKKNCAEDVVVELHKNMWHGGGYKRRVIYAFITRRNLSNHQLIKKHPP